MSQEKKAHNEDIFEKDTAKFHVHCCMVIEKTDGHQRQTVKRLGDTVWQPGHRILEGLTRLRDQRVFFHPASEIKNGQTAGCLGYFCHLFLCSNIRRVAKSSKSRRTYLHFRTFCQLGHGSTLKNQETLLTDDLDITAGAKEKASQLKDLDGSTW